jgi:hypothetical protein
MKPKLQFAPAFACCVLGLALSPGGAAQTTPARPPAAKPSPSTPQAVAPRASAQPATSAQPPTSTEPAKGTATVEFRNGLLHIVATNADLNAVLLQVSQLTGMRVQGATNGDRLYGDYGPAAPSEVLNHLLVGLPYNFVMTQAPRTPAPQQLVISSRHSGAQASSDASNSATANSRQRTPATSQSTEPDPIQSEPSDVEENPPVDEPPPQPMQEPPAPENAPPGDMGTDEQPGSPNGAQAGPKTPEQFLEELKQMRPPPQ